MHWSQVHTQGRGVLIACGQRGPAAGSARTLDNSHFCLSFTHGIVLPGDLEWGRGSPSIIVYQLRDLEQVTLFFLGLDVLICRMGLTCPTVFAWGQNVTANE